MRTDQEIVFKGLVTCPAYLLGIFIFLIAPVSLNSILYFMLLSTLEGLTTIFIFFYVDRIVRKIIHGIFINTSTLSLVDKPLIVFLHY